MSAETEKIRLLLVEDEAAHAALIMRSFDRARDRFEVHSATTLAQARELLSSGRPDLLITDYRLPDGTGLDLLAEEGLVPETPVLVMTSQGDEKIAVEAMKLGALDYIVKSHETLTGMDLQAERVLRQWAHIQDRQKARSELARSEERYRTLIETMNEGLIVVDENNLVTYVNTAFCRMVGLPAGHLVGRSPMELMMPDNREFMSSELAKRRRGEFQPYELTWTSAEGREITTLVSPRAMVDEDGNYRGSFGVVSDITQKRRAEEEKKLLERQLEEARKMEAIGTLAGGIAHDFNNILSSIIGFTELTLADLGDQPGPSRNLTQVLKSAGQAKESVQRILNFSHRAEQDRQSLRVGLLISEALDRIRPSLPVNIRLVESSAVETDLIWADPGQINRVLTVLLENAVLALAGEGGVLEVGLTSEHPDESSPPELRPGEHVVIRVRDTGVGMSPETRNRVFEPFFTTREVGSGSGMGLSVAHGLVRSHKGAITVESRLGQGSTFRVYLPLLGEEEARPGGTGRSLPTGSEQILMVDGDGTSSEFGTWALQSLGYRVALAADHLEFMDLFLTAPEDYDLVLINLPLNQVLRSGLIKELHRIRPRLPVIMGVESAERVSPTRAREIGVRELLAKPLILGELAHTVREALDEVGPSRD